ncbi:MAG TPA: winged helix-turn-helix domain-containing protein, partial [Polyangiaceae bacterium]|nr:winged helix-turn-helix domain-containing protein [Polyangiaceae bacterium]
ILDDPRAQLVPIVVVVANADERDRIVRELTVQLDAVLVRAQSPDPEGAIEVDGLYIDRDGHRVTVRGEEISLTHLEFKLLLTLADRRDRVQSREALLSDVWGLNPQSKTRTVDTHIKRLRGKLRSAGRFVQSVRGVGYRFSDRPATQRIRGDHRGQVEVASVVAA